MAGDSSEEELIIPSYLHKISLDGINGIENYSQPGIKLEPILPKNKDIEKQDYFQTLTGIGKISLEDTINLIRSNSTTKPNSMEEGYLLEKRKQELVKTGIINQYEKQKIENQRTTSLLSPNISRHRENRRARSASPLRSASIVKSVIDAEDNSLPIWGQTIQDLKKEKQQLEQQTELMAQETSRLKAKIQALEKTHSAEEKRNTMHSAELREQITQLSTLLQKEKERSNTNMLEQEQFRQQCENDIEIKTKTIQKQFDEDIQQQCL